MSTAKTALSPALLLAALLIGAAGVALGMALDRGSAPATSSTTTDWSGGSAGPAMPTTSGAPSTAWGTSTPSPADDLAAGQATIISALWTPVPTAAPPTATPAPYRSPTPTPGPEPGHVRIGER
jgi:hypothetical protein